MRTFFRISLASLALFSFASFASFASAQTLNGTGDNFGSGWRSDGNGGLRGTGNNFGSGWRYSD